MSKVTELVRQSQGSNQCLSHSIPELLTTKVGIPDGEDTNGHATMDGSNCEALGVGKRRLRGDTRNIKIIKDNWVEDT